MTHAEQHRLHRSGWLRASVMGANDGIVSTASLIVGVAAADADMQVILLAGFSGMFAGAMSMAAGEYVSVSSQADIERADLQIEAQALAENHDLELEELAEIYVSRGLDAALAREVARQLMEHDALGAHARDDIGIVAEQRANPLLAAGSSGLTFTIGALLPLMAALLAPRSYLIPMVALASLVFLAALGALAARVGGAPQIAGAARVTLWGALAMLVTAAVGVGFDSIF